MMAIQFPPPLVIEHWLLIVSGVVAWLGIPVLTCIAVDKAVRRAKTSLRKWQRGLSAFAAGSALFIWMQWFHNPLPSDRFLMDYFQQHRAEFEQLVQGYRNYRRPDLPGIHYYEKLPNVRALMEKLSVNHIVDAQGPSGRWYPDHYSPETIRKEKLYFGWGRSIGNQLTEEERMAILRREIPLVFEGVAPLHDVLDVARVTSVIYLFLGHKDYIREDYILDAHRLAHPGLGINKGYYYFPQPPRIENGHILVHDFHSPDGLGRGLRVFDSLDSYPPNWKKGECVLKPIDAQWFIAMCRAS